MFAQRRKDNGIFDQIESDDNEIKVSGNSLGLSNPVRVVKLELEAESRGGLGADAFPLLQTSFYSEMNRTLHHPRDWLEDTCRL